MVGTQLGQAWYHLGPVLHPTRSNVCLISSVRLEEVRGVVTCRLGATHPWDAQIWEGR